MSFSFAPAPTGSDTPRPTSTSAEELLAESQRRYRTLIEALPQLIWACKQDGRCEFLNSSWVQYTGVPEERQLGYAWLEVLHPSDRERVFQCWRNAVEQRASYDLEYRIRRYDGEFRWFKTRGVPLRGEGGEILQWLGTCTDIHDQKLAEAALLRSNEDLNQFAYAVSHDLQEPLRMVGIYTELLSCDVQGKLTPEADLFLRNIGEGSRRLDTLLRDLREYIRAGEQREPRRSVASSAVALDRALQNLRTRIDETGALVEHGAMPEVLMDEVHLLQVFQNLIGNALKYRGVDPPRITVSAERRDVEWLLSIQDNGVGIPPRYARQIFGVFKRLHGHAYPGTGIGLAICHKLIERCGGQIWVDPTPGGGSTFRFTVPTCGS